MPAPALPPLGLYLHLPWCERKCPYCDFNSHQREILPEADYIDALLADLADQESLLQGREIETLFIGGGTPSLFSGAAIAHLLEALAQRLPLASDLEATMEANPGSAEADKFAAFRSAGINRLSIGVQSFGDQQLLSLGRVHDSEQARRALRMARRAGFDNLNIDLMHGLPGQDPAAAARDLSQALDFEPGHLSWYQLTIEANTVFYKRPPVLPVEDLLADIQDRGEQLLAAAGYGQYEVSAYSRDGYQCRHNRNYWQFGDYLGAGAGAHGKVTLASGEVCRLTAKKQPDDYLSRPTARQRTILQPAELRGEFMLNALRLREGFSLALYEQRTGLQADSLAPQLQGLCERGLLEQAGDRISATPLGWRFLDAVIAEFLPA